MTTKPALNHHYKLIRVKRSDGRLTTVSLDPRVVAKAVQVLGGLRSVGKLVRELAFQYIDGSAKSCSSYVEEHLLKAIKPVNLGLVDTQVTAKAAENPADARTSQPPTVTNALSARPPRGGRRRLPESTSPASNSKDTSARQDGKDELSPLSPYFMDLLLKCAKNEHRTQSNMLEYLVLEHSKRLQILATR